MGASVFDKTSPFSTPTKPSAKLTSSVEAKENRLASPSFMNQMKPSSKKNFMSPTISASSKTVAQRKKILAERNGGEATEPTCAKFHHRRSSSFDLKQQGSVDMSVSTDSLSSSINEINSVEDGFDAANTRPYDPVLNYCSPRPKFLLYNPNRKSEILRRYEMIDSTSSESEASVEHEECLVKPNGEVTEEAREFVDQKDEIVAHIEHEIKGCAEDFKEKMQEPVEEVAKKNEDHNEVFEHIESHNEVHESIENHCKEFKKELAKNAEVVKDSNMINQLETESRSLKLENETREIKIEAFQNKDDDNEKRILCMETEDDEENEGEFEEEGDVESCWSFKTLLKVWLVTVILGLSILYLFSMNSTSVGLNVDDLHRADNASAPVFQNELTKMVFDEASRRIKGEIFIREPDHYTGKPLEDVNEVKNEGLYVKVFSEVVDAELVGVPEADKVEAVENKIDLASEVIVTEVAEAVNVVDIPEENTTPEIHELDVSADAKYHTEVTLDENVALEDSNGNELKMGEDRGVNDVTDSFGDGILNNLEKEEEVTEVVSTPVMVDDDGLLMRYSKESVKTAIVVGAVSSSLLAVIVFLGLQKMKRANRTLQEESANESEQAAFRRQHHVKQVDHFACSPYSKLGANSFNRGTGAPSVQLLGEYTVGEKEVSSYSLRTDYVENYNDSSCSFPQRNLKMSASQPAISGFSSTTGTPPYGGESSQRRSHKKDVPASSVESPSYGSFTTEMMFRTKEEARSVEKVIVTPVRRSSRIHCRRTPAASQ